LTIQDLLPVQDLLSVRSYCLHDLLPIQDLLPVHDSLPVQDCPGLIACPALPVCPLVFTLQYVPLERQTLSPAVCDVSNSRDKIQERFVELLAQAAARATVPVRPDVVDESRLCGSPGKIVDVGILEQLLRLPPAQQVFYGPGICGRDVSCYRIGLHGGLSGCDAVDGTDTRILTLQWLDRFTIPTLIPHVPPASVQRTVVSASRNATK